MNRYCVLLFVFFVLLMPGEASIKRYCRQKTKVSWDSLKRLKAGDYTRLDLKTKCYLRCFMEKIGVINNESELEIEKVLRHFPHDTQGRMRTLLQQCKYKLLPSDHLCEKAYKIAKCIIKAYPEIFKKLSFV
ncbi:hypothetical protein KM043_006684 [Ampulex compressa]|nr:hypothetical protein KM043_006684 [Ampulex compressa]